MKILVLGGTGAMGVPVVKILSSKGHDITVTSRKERKSKDAHIRYIIGDAHDYNLLNELFKYRYDAIIDFMIYDTETFRQRVEMFLNNTDQYFYFSSARVYADSGEKYITEDSPRLLDVTKDKNYLVTDEYALAKAREEEILKKSGRGNWTIIRPYITYNDERLQLGTFEKEAWIYRALHGKAIVFGRDVASKLTTLTYGYDVALRIASLVGKKEALGETVHITTKECIRWKSVLDIYLNILEKELGYRPRVSWVDNSTILFKETSYQLIYDRLYDRKFDNSKINSFSNYGNDYMGTEEGLSKCLLNFLKSNRKFRYIDWRTEAKFDRITGDKTKIKEIGGLKNKIKYVLFRYVLNELTT